MNAIELALERAERRVLDRIQALEPQLGTDGDGKLWNFYIAAVEALVVLARERQRPGQLLTTGQLADRLGVSRKTIQRQRKTGALTPAMARGRVIRWSLDSVPRGTGYGTAPSGASKDAPGLSLRRAVRGERRR